MYLDYFSLERHPFRITPDTSLFYSGGDRGRGMVLDALVFAIENGEGILKVVGEVGSGKTMLCRMLEERLPQSTEIVYLANPNLSPDEILYAVAFELKLPVRRETSRLLVMQILQDYLLEQHALNRKVLITIEEAQSMPFETLEEIRLFSNLETRRDKLMQIIMFGQPELDQNLSARNIRQLRERITHSFYLNPLTTKESVEYIQFRIGAAGCPYSQLLTAKAGWLIAKASGGLTRRLNILTDKALLAAYADGALATRKGVLAPVVNWRHAYAAIRDSDYSLFPLRGLFTPLRVMSASIVLVVMAVTFLVWPNSSGVASQSSVVASLFKLPAGSLNAVNELIGKPRTRPVLVADVIQAVTDETNLDDSGISTSLEMNIAFADNNDIEATVDVVEELSDGSIAEERSAQAISSSGTSEQAEANDRVAGRSLIQERVVAAVSWLRDNDRSGYTVQFLSGEMEELKLAESLLDTLDEAGMIEETYMCMRTSISRNYWTIKVGTFTGVSLAQQFVDKLPDTMKNYKPYVQVLSSRECNANTTIAALILE